MAMDGRGRTPEQQAVFRRLLAERAAALPGVRSAAYAGTLPLGAGSGRRSFGVEGYRPGATEDMEIHYTWAGAGYFRTMGTRLLRGREFSSSPNAPAAVIVNAAFAARYLPGQDPIGKRLGDGPGDQLYMEIVGVAENGKYVSLGEEPRPFVWLAASQQRGESPFLSLVVRGDANVAALARPLRRLVAELDPDVAVTDVVIADQHLAFALLPQKVGAWLLGLFGLLGLGLAALGVYGVTAFAVNQRTHEFGVRLALGAQHQALTRMVVRQGMVVAGSGAASGLVLAGATSRLLTALLYDVPALDPITFAGVTALVLAVAFIANWLPARRTARLDPLRALRFE
jgi:predicted permease